jgi:hypothetical protein
MRRKQIIRAKEKDAIPSPLNCRSICYLTQPEKSGFPPHFGITDAFIIQIVGMKEWMIYPATNQASRKPLTSLLLCYPDGRWRAAREICTACLHPETPLDHYTSFDFT